MSAEDSSPIAPVEYEIKLVHHKQRYNWDCGVSCVLMVLPNDEREFFVENFHSICKEEGFSKSTWTIDLCYLLKRFSMNFVFYTTTLGIHPQHKGQHFYEKILHKDEERVTERFNNAKSNGICVRKKSMNTNDLIKHLKKHGPVILLTNASYLYCDRCKKNKLTNELMNCLPWVASYHGHYIVLCGYDLNRKKLYYRNPTFSNRVCVMGFTALNKARLSYGTDEDLQEGMLLFVMIMGKYELRLENINTLSVEMEPEYEIEELNPFLCKNFEGEKKWRMKFMSDESFPYSQKYRSNI